MNKKRGIRTWFLTVVMFVTLFLLSVTGEAAFVAARSGVNYPTTLNVGQIFGIQGTVEANAIIAKAVVTIYDATGTKCLQRYSEVPNSTIFQISHADLAMEFDKLTTGEYYYRVSIYDAYGAKISIVDRKFTVGKPETVLPVLKKTGINYPKNLKVGQEFSMKGTITTTFVMKSAVFTIYKGNTCLQRYTAPVNTTVYSVKNADPYLQFDKLPAGKYYYRICVYNQADQKFRVLNRKFTVKAAAAIKINNPVPSANVTITKGSSYALGGKIASVYKLVNVTAGILDASGNIVYSKAVNPNATTYNLKNSLLDNALYFEKLPVGTYTLKVIAKDSVNTTVTLINRVITVKSSGGTVVPDPEPSSKDDIQIVYSVPEGDITLQYGHSFNLGGVVVGRYKLNLLEIKLTTSGGALVEKLQVNPASKVYVMDNSVLDAAIEFETLPKGAYVLTLTGRDIKNNTCVIMTRKITIK